MSTSGGGGGGDPAGVKRPVVMPDSYYGEGEWIDYVQGFEACADVNSWDEATKCKFLFICLKGQPRKVFNDLEEDVKTNWNTLKVELKKRLDTTTSPDLYKSEFMSRRKLSTENYHDFGNAIRTLARKAYPSLPSNVRDELAKDQFLRGLEKIDLVIKVKHEKPESLDEAVRMAVEWEAVELDVKSSEGGATAKDSQCSAATVAGANQNVTAASVDKTEELMGLMKDMISLMKDERGDRSFPSSRGVARGRGRGVGRGYQGRGVMAGIQCWGCGESGHRKSDCPRSRSRSGCWICGDLRHIQYDCPNRRKQGEGNA